MFNFTIFLVIILLICYSTFAKLTIRKNPLKIMKLPHSLFSSSSDNNEPYGRPTVIPYDFVREDNVTSKPSTSEKKPKIEKPPEDENDDRPTGYANDIDEDPQWLPNSEATNPPIVQFLKEVYVGNEFDSTSKKQARYVIRNVTGISLVIGLIFTIIWYAFPGELYFINYDHYTFNLSYFVFVSFKGQFVSFRGDEDFSARYPHYKIITDDILKNNNDNQFGQQQNSDYFIDNSVPPGGTTDSDEL